MNREIISEYDDALRGEREVHVWRGKPSPWMKTTIVDTGTYVDPDPGMSEEFVKGTGMYYDGIMPAEEVQDRLDQFENCEF